MTGGAEDDVGLGLGEREDDGRTGGAEDGEGVGEGDDVPTGGAEDGKGSKALHSVATDTFLAVLLEEFEFFDFRASSVSTMI